MRRNDDDDDEETVRDLMTCHWRTRERERERERETKKRLSGMLANKPRNETLRANLEGSTIRNSQEEKSRGIA